MTYNIMKKSFLSQNNDKNETLNNVIESNYENLIISSPSFLLNSKDDSDSTYKYIFNIINIPQDNKSNINPTTYKQNSIFKCEADGCQKVYKSKENLTLHIKNIHLNLKPYKCRFCNMTFSHRNGILN
jgi:hypothetical protein